MQELKKSWKPKRLEEILQENLAGFPSHFWKKTYNWKIMIFVLKLNSPGLLQLGFAWSFQDLFCCGGGCPQPAFPCEGFGSPPPQPPEGCGWGGDWPLGAPQFPLFGWLWPHDELLGGGPLGAPQPLGWPPWFDWLLGPLPQFEFPVRIIFWKSIHDSIS